MIRQILAAVVYTQENKQELYCMFLTPYPKEKRKGIKMGLLGAQPTRQWRKFEIHLMEGPQRRWNVGVDNHQLTNRRLWSWVE